MRKTRYIILCLVMVILLGCLAQPCYAELRDDNGRYLYMDIPYESITPEGVEQVVKDKLGAVRDENENFNISDFGHNLILSVTCDKQTSTVKNILLYRPGDMQGVGDEFEAMVNGDIELFADIEARLTERYGAPNTRYFYTFDDKAKRATPFMLEGGFWSVEQLRGVLYDKKQIWASSVWDNFGVRLWVSWRDEETHKSVLTIDFSNKIPYADVYGLVDPSDIIAYPVIYDE